MFDVFLDCLLGDCKSASNLFVGPSLQKVLDHGDFSSGQTKELLCLLDYRFLPPTERLDRDQDPGLTAVLFRDADSAEQDGLNGIAHDPLDSEVFPILGLGANLQELNDFTAEGLNRRR